MFISIIYSLWTKIKKMSVRCKMRTYLYIGSHLAPELFFKELIFKYLEIKSDCLPLLYPKTDEK